MIQQAPAPAGPRIRLAQAAFLKVALRLCERHGQHQFYAFAQVREAAGGIDVDPELMPWVFAGLLPRADFEAYFALRDVPGDYRQLRTDLNGPASPPSAVCAPSDDFEEQLEALREWLDLAVEIAGTRGF